MKKSFSELAENASAGAVGGGAIASTPGSFKGEWPDPEKPKRPKVKVLSRNKSSTEEETR